MPLTLNVGFTRKVGEANFSSRGASVNVEVELDGTLVAQPSQLQEKMRYLFGVAKDAVDAELNGDAQNSDHRNGNGRERNGDSPRPATASQVRAIHAIASRQRLDLSEQLQDRFRVQKPDELSIKEASQLIDALKSENGAGARR